MPARRPLPHRPAAGTSEGAPGSLASRLAWFAGLWVASVAALGVVGYGIKFWLGA